MNRSDVKIPKIELYRVLRNSPMIKSIKPLPKWYAKIDVNMFEERWLDWTSGEIDALKKRLEKGFTIELLDEIFGIPNHIKELLGLIPVKVVDEAIASDEFTEHDIEDPSLRQLANNRWREYAGRINMNNPVNRTTVRSMIVLEIQMKKIERVMLNRKMSSEEMHNLQQIYESISKRYSAAAEDVAQLERQHGVKPEVNGFEDVVKRLREIRNDWKDYSLLMKMEEVGLINKMVELHKVNVEQKKLERTIEHKVELEDFTYKVPTVKEPQPQTNEDVDVVVMT
ncbi:MAG: hypothetical protein QXS29_09710 [Nitrososphaeria archaeon]